MSDKKSYRQQASAVRAEAQNRLRELRAERRAKSRFAGRKVSTLERAPVDSGSQETVQAVQMSVSPSLHSMLGQTMDLDGSKDLSVVDTSAPKTSEPKVGEATGKRAGMAPGHGVPGGAVRNESVTVSDTRECDAGRDPGIDTLEHSSDPQPGDVHTDLIRLPGAGEGLIWLLQQNDIFTLKDLANADSEELSRKLSLVGQLIRLDTWIAFAKSEAGNADAVREPKG